MKTKTKTKAVKKVTKEKAIKKNYEEMYNSQQVLIKNLQDEINYEQDLRVSRGETINDLGAIIEDKIDEINAIKFDRTIFSAVGLLVGILLGYALSLF